MASKIQGITVEIGGDTTKLSNALKGVNTEIKSTQNQLKDVEKLLKLDPTNTELLVQKQKLLSSAIGETKNKLDTLKIAQQQAKAAFDKGEITRQQYDALQREIVETEQSLKSLEKQAKQTNTTLIGIQQAANKIGAFGESCSEAGTKMLPLTATITAVGVASSKMAMDFEDAMAKVATIADTTEIPIQELESVILSLSNQTGISSTEIAQNVYDAISAGQSTGDAVNFVSNSTKLAKAGFTDAGSALDVLTTIMNAYGLEANAVNSVCDTLIQTQNLGKTTVGELASSMGKIIPTAKANGVALDQVATGYAIMTSKGVATAESTTYMNAMLNELGKSGTKVADTLKSKTGNSFAELMNSGYSLSDVLQLVSESASEQGMAFTDLWGSSEAGRAGLILLGDSVDNFNNTLSQMQSATGATDTAFEKLQTNSNTIKIAMNQLKNTAIELGSTLMSVLAPIIQSLAEKISQFTTWFSGLNEGTKKMIIVIGGLAAAIGPFLIIIGKVATGISSIMNLVSVIGPAISALIPVITSVGWPILAVVAAIAAVIAIGNLLINHWDEVKSACQVIWNTIKDFFASVWNAIKEIFLSASENIRDLLIKYFNIYQNIIESVTTSIKNVIENVWNTIQNVFTTVFKVIQTIIKTYFDTYQSIITAVSNAIQTTIEAVLDTIKTVIQTVMAAIQTIFSTTWNAIRTIVTTLVGGIKALITRDFESMKNALNSIMNTIKNTMSTVWNTIKNTTSTTLNLIKSTVTTIFNSIVSSTKTAMSDMYTAIKSGFDRSVSFIKGLASSAYTWGADMINGIVSGIKSCIGKVESAVKSVADKMRSFLHFSVPDEGPLTDYETWMPDFMSGLAKGIEKSKYLVTNAVSDLAGDMMVNPTINTSRMAGVTTNTNSANLNDVLSSIQTVVSDLKAQPTGDICIPVYVGGTLLDEVVINAQTRQNLRSGGR